VAAARPYRTQARRCRGCCTALCRNQARCGRPRQRGPSG
jgi:hypothetical protein